MLSVLRRSRLGAEIRLRGWRLQGVVFLYFSGVFEGRDIDFKAASGPATRLVGRGRLLWAYKVSTSTLSPALTAQMNTMADGEWLESPRWLLCFVLTFF